MESSCHCIRKGCDWDFGRSRKVEFLKRDPSLTLIARDDDPSRIVVFASAESTKHRLPYERSAVCSPTIVRLKGAGKMPFDNSAHAGATKPEFPIAAASLA